MYAVVRTGGKQYRVEQGGELVVEKLDASVGDSVDFDVLFFSDGTDVVADPGAVSSASVTAEVVEQFKGDKVVVFKFKKRKGYSRTRGHRQEFTRVKVTKIAGPSGAPKRPSKPREAKRETVAKSPERVVDAVEVSVETVQCEAVTGSGERCKNKAKEGSKYCGVHAKKYAG